jgi:hypothetical protein
MKSEMQIPPALTIDARRNQLLMGIVPTSGRGANGGTSPLPQGATWMPHAGRRQKMRAYDQAWAKFEKHCRKGSTYAATTRERLLDWLAEEAPTPEQGEFAAKAIVFSAMLNQTKERDYVDQINLALNEMEIQKDKMSETQPTEEAAGV